LSHVARVDIVAVMASPTAHETADGGRTPRATTMLVIAGMHRSGTSAVARSCNLLGVDLGSDFIPTQPDNRSGFWEDASVKTADDLALASHGLLWDDVRPMPEPWRDGFGGAEIRARLLDTLGALARRGSLCGVKDPRISRLLPLWLPVIEQLGVNPVFLISLRDPGEVALSLARRDALGDARSLLLWLRYNLEAERHTRGHRRVFVCFDDLLRDWRAALDRAAAALGIAWPVPHDEAAPAIETFLDPSLRHAHAAPAAREGLAGLAHDAFVALRALGDADTPERRAELDQIHAALAAGDRTLGAVVAELEEALAAGRAAAVGEPDGARSAQARELVRARREAMLSHELVGTRDRELADATARWAGERDALARRIAAIEAARDARTAEAAARQRERDALEVSLQVQRVELAALRAERDAALQVVAGVERSISWRLTAPLRALAAALRPRHGER
jgi:hypothetical protein